MSSLRRYGPALVGGAALLIAIAAAPSRGAAGQSGYPDPFAAGATGSTGVAGSAGGTGTGTTGAGGTGPAATGTGATGSGTATGAAGTGTGTAASGGRSSGSGKAANGLSAGDTSHCVGGKQFGGLATAPPCQPTFVGNNGGATSTGVTGKTIEIVYYREGDNAVVQSYEQAYGIYSTPADQMAFAKAAQTFINKNYELYGRTVHIDYVQSPGGCSPSPPDDTCFRGDAKQIVAKYHPFAVFYENNTNTPGFFDELSKAHVINWGGWHFADSFSTQRRPYHYDIYTAGDTQAQEFGEWYCKRLADQDATFAGTAALQGAKRKVGILVQDIDINVAPAQHLAQIIDNCDSNGAQVFTYDPDTGKSQEQSVTLVSQMKNAGITSVLYFCDPIAPQFFTTQATSQGFQPENIVVGSGLIDYDTLAQAYDATQWKHAFGISDLADSQPTNQIDANYVWTHGGGTGTVYTSGNLPWSYLSGIATGLQQAGPTLDPGTFERGLLTLPAVGGTTTEPLVKFGPGDYSAISDYREVYWSATTTSKYDNKAGAYIPLSEQRYTLGHAPSGSPHYPAGV